MLLKFNDIYVPESLKVALEASKFQEISLGLTAPPCPHAAAYYICVFAYNIFSYSYAFGFDGANCVFPSMLRLIIVQRNYFLLLDKTQFCRVKRHNISHLLRSSAFTGSSEQFHFRDNFLSAQVKWGAR